MKSTMSKQSNGHVRVDRSSCTCDQSPNSAGQGPSMRGHDKHCPVRIGLVREIHRLGLCSCADQAEGQSLNVDTSECLLDLLAWDISDAFAKDADLHGLDLGLDEIRAALPAFIDTIRSRAAETAVWAANNKQLSRQLSDRSAP